MRHWLCRFGTIIYICSNNFRVIRRHCCQRCFYIVYSGKCCRRDGEKVMPWQPQNREIYRALAPGRAMDVLAVAALFAPPASDSLSPALILSFSRADS